VGQKLVPLVAKSQGEDLLYLKELIEKGEVMPVIDRTYSLSEAPEAMSYLEAGHTRGKVVVTI
jgi:NADPH:quinone reductase-like Zn-dependent oxidoreductase